MLFDTPFRAGVLGPGTFVSNYVWCFFQMAVPAAGVTIFREDWVC